MKLSRVSQKIDFRFLVSIALTGAIVATFMLMGRASAVSLDTECPQAPVPQYVGLNKESRARQGPVDMALSGEVYDSLNFKLHERPLDCGAVADVLLDEKESFGEIGPQVVQSGQYAGVGQPVVYDDRI